MKISELLILKCTDLTNQGMGVAHLDRFPFFVSNLLPGEEAEVEIVSLRSKFGIGKVKKRFTDSPDRVQPICPYFDICGGCQTMHMKDQDAFKFNQVNKILKRVTRPLVASPQQLGYRNKMVFKAEKNKIGFYKLRSNEIVDIDYCYLQSELKNNILTYIREHYKDLTEVTIRGDEEIMVSLSSDSPINPKPLFNHFEEIRSVYVNSEHQMGERLITKEINHIKFNLSLDSFFQVNTLQTEFLYKKIVELAEFNKDDTVLDLYCGVGSIALSIARDVKKVIGVEINEQAMNDANINKELNRIDNVEFVCQDATVFLADFNEPINTIIVDPPRKGLAPQGITDIINSKADKVIYVSCDLMTLNRDLNLLSQHYNIDTITPFDMFPQTYHVETVVLMSRVDK
jgi:23S rRNA (uracil1939-C5)-methyltransferase